MRSDYRMQSAELYLDKGDRQVWKIKDVIHDLNTREEKGGEIPVLVVREKGVWSHQKVVGVKRRGLTSSSSRSPNLSKATSRSYSACKPIQNWGETPK